FRHGSDLNASQAFAQRLGTNRLQELTAPALLLSRLLRALFGRFLLSGFLSWSTLRRFLRRARPGALLGGFLLSRLLFGGRCFLSRFASPSSAATRGHGSWLGIRFRSGFGLTTHAWFFFLFFLFFKIFPERLAIAAAIAVLIRFIVA